MIRPEWSALKKLLALSTASGEELTEYTATGNPATFETDAARNLKSLTIQFESQNGLTGLKVYRSSRNLVAADIEIVNGYFINASGEVTQNASYKYTPVYIDVKPNTVYTCTMVKTVSVGLAFSVPVYDENKDFVRRDVVISSSETSGAGTYSGQFTTPGNAKYIHFSVPLGSDSIQIEEGQTATDYEEPTAFPVTWETEAGSVESGTFEAVTGVLTVTAPTAGVHQIDPVNIKTLIGTNNIWTDAESDNTVKYLKKG